MARKRRLQFIGAIEKARNSRVICYITSTRPGLDSSMQQSHVRVLYDHLLDAKNKDIDLFIHSDGGDATVPWRLVNLIREQTKKRFSVLIPYRAFSAATMTALGADRIVMHPMGNLGPTDPNVKNPFNPKDALGRPVGISVEDVNAYIELIKKDVGITHEDELVDAFLPLAQQIHPLALGNVKRFMIQSRLIMRKILRLHMAGTEQEHRIEELVDTFTSKLYFHGHPVSRDEASGELGLHNIEKPTQKLEKLMWNLYLEYEKEMEMKELFDPPTEFVKSFPNLKSGEERFTKPRTANHVYIESTKQTDIDASEYQIYGKKADDGSIDWSMNLLKQGWISEK